ncbi:hypothetical protein ACW2Q0_21370 [Nocardia sp. R16R-3T]
MLERTTLDSPDVLVVDDGYLKATWPYLGDRLRDGLVSRDFTVMWESLPTGGHLRDIPGIAEVPALVVLGVEPEAADIAALPRLAVVAGVTGAGLAVAPELAVRGIPRCRRSSTLTVGSPPVNWPPLQPLPARCRSCRRSRRWKRAAWPAGTRGVVVPGSERRGCGR